MSTEQQHKVAFSTPFGENADSHTRGSLRQNGTDFSEVDGSFNDSFVSHPKNKDDLRELNERLALYIKRVGYLTTRNKQLEQESSKSRTSQKTVTERLEKIKEKCQTEIEDKSAIVIEEMESLLRRSNEIHAVEINEIKERLEESEQLVKHYRNRYATSNETLISVRRELELETLRWMAAKREYKKLEGQLLFSKEVYQWERTESTFESSTVYNRTYWDSRVDQTVGQIKHFYEIAIGNAQKEQNIFIEKRMSYEKMISDLKMQLASYETRSYVPIHPELQMYRQLLDGSAPVRRYKIMGDDIDDDALEAQVMPKNEGDDDPVQQDAFDDNKEPAGNGYDD